MQEVYQAREQPPSTPPPLTETQEVTFSQAEVLSALRKRKLGKATPKGAPTNEMVRLAEQSLSGTLRDQWNNVAQRDTMPEEWRTTDLVWTPKPGHTGNDPKQMRGIR